MWKLSEGNPAKLSAYVNDIVGKAKKGIPAEWSFTVPKNIDAPTKGMNPTQKQLFVSHFKSSVDEFIAGIRKTGSTPTAEQFGKFVDEYADKMRTEIQEVMAQSWDVRNVDNTIRKDGIPNEVPGPADLNGSAPMPPAESSSETRW